MQVKCSVINDLLVLYVDDLCSDDTKKMIEAHLSTCPECKQKLERMQTPVWHENEEKLIVNKSFDEKKVMKKLKKRTNMIVIGILVLIPLLVLCINQKTGRGVSFSSLPQIVKSHQFLSAIEKGEYEKAYSLIAVDEIYSEYVSEENNDYINYLYSCYHEAKIGDTIYYLNDDLYNNQYQIYLKNEDEVNFWYETLMYIENNYVMWAPLPKDKMNLVMETYPKAKSLLKKRYTEEEIGEDDIYLIHHPFSIESTIMRETPIMSQYYYENEYTEYVESMKESAVLKQETYDYFTGLGFEQYNQESQNIFVDNLINQKNKDIYVKHHRIVDVERVFDRVTVTYRLTVSQDGEDIKGIYVMIVCNNEGIIETWYDSIGQSLSDDFLLIKLKTQDNIE